MGRINSIAVKLLVDAFWAALAAFVFGLCAGYTLIKRFDSLSFTGLVLSGALLIFVLFRTRRAVRPLSSARYSTGETKKNARQFLVSCICFAIITATFGTAASGVVWYARDFIRMFGVVWWAGLTCVAIFCVRRDAKRVADLASSQIGPD